MKTVSAVIPAAGSGERLGKGYNKVLAPVAGKPILAHTLAAFENCEAVDEVIIVTGECDLEAVGELVGRFGYNKVRAITKGGNHRQDSVANGLKSVTGDIVAIHDAARPLVTPEIITASIEAAREHGACITAVPVIDTIKTASDGVVVGTIERKTLYSVQTPQTFRTELILKAYHAAFAEGFYATDDSALVERIGEQVRIVSGSYDNIKITTPADLRAASAGLGGVVQRTGLGFDVHAFAQGRRLVLGGVEIDYDKGLAGHSDADVVLHAVSDALLGAASLGDIGKYFPDTDPQYKGISSLDLLARVGRLLVDAGWAIANIDAVVICEMPKIAPYTPLMSARIGEALGIDPSCVSVKGTTTEKLGFTGRGEGIACQAIASVASLGI